MRKFAVLSICIFWVCCLAAASTASAASAEEAALQVVEKFNEIFNTSDFDQMSSLYLHSDKTSAFGPHPMGPFLIQGWDEMKETWKTTPDEPPGTYAASLHHPKVTLLTDEVAVFTGYMTVLYTDPATKAQDVGSVRQTFVLQKVDGKWQIVHNHASFLPTD